VQEHYLRCGGKYYPDLLEIFLLFSAVKNFENRLTFEKVIAKSLVASFFWNTVYIHCVQKKTPTHIFFHISMSDVLI